MNERDEPIPRGDGIGAGDRTAPGTEPGLGATGEAPVEDFAPAQQQALVAIGQALIEQATPGVVALDLRVTQTVRGGDVDLDFDLSMARQSGLTLPAEAGDALVEAVQQLVLVWRAHGREPWRTFSYQLTRGETGPRFTSEFSF